MIRRKPDLHLFTWLTSKPTLGPRLLSLACGGLIAVELARISLSLLGANPVSRSEAATANLTQQAPERLVPALDSLRVDVHTIVAAHLFGVAEEDPSTQDPARAPPTTSNLVLAGTIATEDPKRGMAIINSSGPANVYAVGDRVGDASLHSVYLDHVILVRDGRLESLVLPRLLLAGKKPALPQPAAAQSVADTRVDPRRLAQKDPQSLADVMRTEASFDKEEGKLRGFRIYPGRNRVAFNGSGLRGGDLVTAINGTPLQDQDRQRSQDIFDSIQSSSSVTVTIERNGHTRDFTVNMAQIAAVAGKP
jgi:general secretion pathway protein C